MLYCLLFNQRLRSKGSTFIYGQSKCSKLIIQFAVVFLYSAKVSYNFEEITSCCVNGVAFNQLLPVLLDDMQIFESKSCCTTCEISLVTILFGWTHRCGIFTITHAYWLSVQRHIRSEATWLVSATTTLESWVWKIVINSIELIHIQSKTQNIFKKTNYGKKFSVI